MNWMHLRLLHLLLTAVPSFVCHLAFPKFLLLFLFYLLVAFLTPLFHLGEYYHKFIYWIKA